MALAKGNCNWLCVREKGEGELKGKGEEEEKGLADAPPFPLAGGRSSLPFDGDEWGGYVRYIAREKEESACSPPELVGHGPNNGQPNWSVGRGGGEKQDCGDFAALFCTLTKYGKVDYFADSMSTITIQYHHSVLTLFQEHDHLSAAAISQSALEGRQSLFCL